MGPLFPRGTLANVAAYGSGRGLPTNVPATNLEIGYDRGRLIGLPGSTDDGYPVLVLDRLELAMITDRVWRFIRTENPWVGDSHSVYYQTFQNKFKLGKLAKYS
ncbi:hypothetical protein PIB30_054302 [Stylosanthes scabra]|uniref:Riboflavin kinase n=1 Tax=Stylosanthes scabra TaxID=79078 RepID=A0ABU6ZHG3_9FABA|nr:hypothetical protein [Stylosanthes scabra]